ncbi:Hypothetical protein, putative [Bodo saltans]|uniref:Uncharacterized protein n=1 Tax=Bodo saltans TaxID=75058 RepID=A0A0S4ITK3_BODSA|nr:Hypothetical protein, putative [Bodo saltans]|eukprot:CUG06616.1 Hypothetical protein, putative [Bodo saltans]
MPALNSRPQRPASAQPQTRQTQSFRDSNTSSSHPQQPSEATSLLRRARGAGVETTPMDLQRYCELQEQVDRVLSAPPPTHVASSGLLSKNTGVGKLQNNVASPHSQLRSSASTTMVMSTSSTPREALNNNFDPTQSMSLFSGTGTTVTLDSLKRMPSVVNLHHKSEAAAAAGIATGLVSGPPTSVAPQPPATSSTNNHDSANTTSATTTTTGRIHEIAKKWIPVSVKTEPTAEDSSLSQLLDNVERRRALRLSYPREGEDPTKFAQQSEAQQKHTVTFAFSERDVLPPDSAALLDSKATVRDILTKHDDRTVFKHNAEGDLEEWLLTLPSTAKGFDSMVHERFATLDQELTDEQKSLAAVEAGTVMLETSLNQLSQFGTHMFDTIFEMEDQRAEIALAEAKSKKRGHRSIGTTTTIVVSSSMSTTRTAALTPVSSPLSPSGGVGGAGASSSGSVPYGCKLLPEELFALAPPPQSSNHLETSLRGGHAVVVSPNASVKQPPGGGGASFGGVEPLDVSIINASFQNHRTPTLWFGAGGAISPSNSTMGSGAGGIEQTLAAFHQANALTAEVERLRRECERREMEKRQFSNFARERMDALADENAALAKVVAEARKDIQMIFVEVSGVDVPWEEVGNGRTAAEFLRDALPMFAEAVTQSTRSDISAALLHQVKADVNEEILELKRSIAAWPPKLTALEHSHQASLSSALKRLGELENAVSIKDAQLADVNELLAKTRGALAKTQDEAETWKRDFLKRCDALHSAHDVMHDAESRRKAAESQAAKTTQSAHRIADTLMEKLSKNFDRERKSLERQINELNSDKKTLQKEFSQQQSLLQSKIERLEGNMEDIRNRTVDQSVLRQVLEEVVFSFSGALTQQSKRLRDSFLKDLGGILRRTSSDVCLQLSKTFHAAIGRVSNILELYFETTSNTSERNRLHRVEHQMKLDIDECNRSANDLLSITDPVEAVTQALRLHVTELEAACSQLTAAAVDNEALARTNGTQHQKRLEAVVLLMKHLQHGVASLMDHHNNSSASSSYQHISWSSVPPPLSESSVINDESVIDGFTQWTPLLQISTETYHNIRHTMQTMSTRLLASSSGGGGALVTPRPPSSLPLASLEGSTTSSGAAESASTLNNGAIVNLEKGGSFLVDFQETFKTLHDGLQPTHVQALKVNANGGDTSSAVALLTCRKSLKQSMVTFGEPLTQFLNTTMPTWSSSRQQQLTLSTSSQAPTPFTHRSPAETPVPSTSVSPTNRSAALLVGQGSALFPSAYEHHAPSRSGSLVVSPSGALLGHRKVDAAVTKAAKSVEGIRVAYTRSIWGVLRLAQVRHHLNEELKVLESRCTILSKACEQRVASVKMERQRFLQAGAGGDETSTQLLKCNAALRLLSETKTSLVDRFAEKLRRFTARRNVAIQQAEAALMRQLNKVVQAMQDASKSLHEFFTRFSAAILSSTNVAHSVDDVAQLPPAALALSGSLSPDPPTHQQQQQRQPPPPALPLASRSHYGGDAVDWDDEVVKQLRTDYDIVRRENTQLKQMMEALQFRQQGGGAAAAVRALDNSGQESGDITHHHDGGSATPRPTGGMKIKSPGSVSRRRQSTAVALIGESSGDKTSTFIPATFTTKQRGSVTVATVNSGGGRGGRRRSTHRMTGGILSTESSPAATPRDVSLLQHHQHNSSTYDASDREEMNSTSELPSITEWAAPFPSATQNPFLESARRSSSATPPPPTHASAVQALSPVSVSTPQQHQQQQLSLQHYTEMWCISFNEAVARCTSTTNGLLPIEASESPFSDEKSATPLAPEDVTSGKSSHLTHAMAQWLSSNLDNYRRLLLLPPSTAVVPALSSKDDSSSHVVRGGAGNAAAAAIRRRSMTQTQRVSDGNENTMPFLDHNNELGSQSCFADDDPAKNPFWFSPELVSSSRREAAAPQVTTSNVETQTDAQTAMMINGETQTVNSVSVVLEQKSPQQLHDAVAVMSKEVQTGSIVHPPQTPAVVSENVDSQ